MKDWMSLCREVENKRDIFSIYEHSLSEVDELEDEIDIWDRGDTPGPDGIVGEAVDVILCMLDLIAQFDPDITTDQVEAVMDKKYAKWKEIYG